jgi:putative transcriptional regulator
MGIMENLIVKYRNKINLSQNKLAKEVGITRPYLSDIERGIKTPGARIAINICKALNATFEDIFFADTVNYSDQSGFRND